MRRNEERSAPRTMSWNGTAPVLCPGCTEDSTFSCQELCNCLGWCYYDQLADTKASAHSFLSTAPHEPNNWVSLHYKVAKLPAADLEEANVPAKKSGFGNIPVPYVNMPWGLNHTVWFPSNRPDPVSSPGRRAASEVSPLCSKTCLPKSPPENVQASFCDGVAASHGRATLPGETATDLFCLQGTGIRYKQSNRLFCVALLCYWVSPKWGNYKVFTPEVLKDQGPIVIAGRLSETINTIDFGQTNKYCKCTSISIFKHFLSLTNSIGTF